MLNISKDVQRYKDIIKGKIKENLKKYISNEEILTRGSKGNISIPLPQIDLPRFKFGKPDSGVGQGDDNGREPGEEAHVNSLEIEVSIDELMDMLAEELQLPRIEPKGKKDLTEYSKYRSLRKIGPESLRSFKHTFKQALKREIASGNYDPLNPQIIPIKEDRRYKAPKLITNPHNQAVIFYLMDVSGSMDEQRKGLARLLSFWTDSWIRRHYKFIQCRYIIHNIEAREVPQSEFYSIKEGGGTLIDSAYKLCADIIKKEYNPAEWNIYVFHYSDGDDASEASSDKAIRTIRDMLPVTNQLSYCQILDTGKFYNTFNSKLKSYPQAVSVQVDSKESIYEALKVLLSKGN